MHLLTRCSLALSIDFRLDPAPRFLNAPGLSRQENLKKTKVTLNLLTDIDMLLKAGKGIRCGMCHPIHQYAKSNHN